jgi:tetratricopeptide (TPR) repeat protein
MNFLSRLFSRKGSGGTRTLFMGVVTSSSIAQEAFAKLNFSHGDREIIASKEDDDAAIMIAGSFSPEEVEEIRSKLGAHSMPEPRVAEVLAPIIAQMEATGTGGKIFVLGRRYSDAEAMKTSQVDNTNTNSNLCEKCGCSEFEYDSYFKEQSCSECGWVSKDVKQVSIQKRAPVSEEEVSRTTPVEETTSNEVAKRQSSAREMVSGSPTADEDFDKVLAAFKRGDYTTALRISLPHAEQGDANSQHNTANCYFYLGDTQEAVTWWRKSALQRFAAAQYSLGLAYFNGDGIIQDYGEAVYWYREAADQGYAAAQYNLGMKYFNGQGTSQDFIQAYLWFELAAIGYQKMLDDGFDMKRHKKDAIHMRKKAAKKLKRPQKEEAQQMVKEWRPKKM